MYFAVICHDKPGALQLRLDTRSAHLDYLEKLNAKGVLKLGGPLLDPEEKPMGSLLVIETDDEAAAHAVAEDDPYALAGLFASVEIAPYKWAFNAPKEA